MLIYAILFLFYLSSGVVNCFDFENLDNDFEVIDPYVGEARFFGNVSNIFNSSLISIVAIFIGGIILFGAKFSFSVVTGNVVFWAHPSQIL